MAMRVAICRVGERPAFMIVAPMVVWPATARPSSPCPSPTMRLPNSQCWRMSFEFVFRQLSPFQQDGVGHADLADVVQRGGVFDQLDHGGFEPQFAGR